MKSKLAAILLAAPLFLTACVAQIVGGGGTGGSGGGAGGSGGSDTGEPRVSATAMTRAQADVAWDHYWATHGSESGSSTTSGAGNLDPNDLFLHFSDIGVTCEFPTADITCGGHWDATLVLPSALQQVGTYALDDPALTQYSSMMESGPGDPSSLDGCDSGGGSFLGGGTLEILSIDASAVHFRLTMSPTVYFDSNPSGEYTAARCQ